MPVAVPDEGNGAAPLWALCLSLRLNSGGGRGFVSRLSIVLLGPVELSAELTADDYVLALQRPLTLGV